MFITFNKKNLVEDEEYDWISAIYPVFNAFKKGDFDIMSRPVVSTYMELLQGAFYSRPFESNFMYDPEARVTRTAIDAYLAATYLSPYLFMKHG